MSETPGWSSPDQPQNQPQQQPPPQYGQQQYGYNAPPPPAQPTIKPGVIPLRPLALGEIIDGAITTMRRYPKLIIGAAAVVAAITQIVGLLVQLPFLADLSTALDPNTTPTRDQLLSTFAGALGGTLIGVLLQLIGTVFLSGFITVVAGHAVLGRQVTFAQAWEEFKPRLLPLLGATLLYGLLIMAAPVVMGLLGVLADSGWVLALGLLVAFLVAVWLWVLFSLVTPALVLERCGVGTAFSRSRKLVTGAWWRTFGILLVAGLIGAVITWIISLPFEALGLATTGFDTNAAVLSAGYLILVTLGAIIASTIALPFSSAVSVLVYVDRRMRSEGMDIELQRAAGHGGS
ncbi:glycerophosphoryl diester phosphodiesterase membrane domain-containing protein [Lentzea sp. NEAU-D7]|uniref:glycerophosphoryl diester phosphodiesterase membrane domain-containing protein n=1 Tax=Lentzea sp. NEAU-D7 TaxID=2994667 RepID=UPI00224A54B6|nr:glycerophosphoryl diester phosphodiesterase membrane domain-containing protein [Lentzea sp. NEAU-D7]MCX2947624.1 glycerophosphoryl diester phosphodiesterase membrane domain-containing protein [Lentzea sp. NEAU-D7]